MGFREHLQDVCNGVDGAVACSLMGVDGIEVDTHVEATDGVDVKSLLVEYSGLFRNAREAAEALLDGGVERTPRPRTRLAGTGEIPLGVPSGDPRALDPGHVAPGDSVSSLKTLKGPKFICSGSRYVSKEKCHRPWNVPFSILPSAR